MSLSKRFSNHELGAHLVHFQLGLFYRLILVIFFVRIYVYLLVSGWKSADIWYWTRAALCICEYMGVCVSDEFIFEKEKEKICISLTEQNKIVFNRQTAQHVWCLFLNLFTHFFEGHVRGVSTIFHWLCHLKEWTWDWCMRRGAGDSSLNRTKYSS